MALKIVLIVIVTLLAILVILPFVLNMVGVSIFQFGSAGGRVTAGEGLLRSRDGGENWESVAVSKDRRTSFPNTVLNFAFHPQNSEVLFLGSRGAGLWRSGDGGSSWQKAADRSRLIDPRGDVYQVVLARSNPKVMYLALFQNNRGRVLKSSDGGETFLEIYVVGANRFGVFGIYVNPLDSEHVRIVTGQGGVLESRNGGSTWRVVRWFSEALTRLVVNPVFPGEMFVITSSGKIFKTFDGGENWADLNEGLQKATMRNEVEISPPSTFDLLRGGSALSLEDFIADPNNFTTLYVGSREGMLRSPDGGFSWRRLNVLIPPEALPVNSVAVDPRNSNIIFATAQNQLHRSADGGENWSVDILPTKSRVKKLLIHPLKPEVMFAVLGR